MKYMVMETELSYAVVLDDNGSFVKVPNLGYEVGQVLDEVVVFDEEEKSAKTYIFGKSIYKFAAAAACFCLMTFGGWNMWQTPAGTVHMKINPEVQMEVNRFDRVVKIEGLNDDGKKLIDGYKAYGEKIEKVSDDIALMAVEQGYLGKGGDITITATSSNKEWEIAIEEKLIIELEIHLDKEITIITEPVEEKPTMYYDDDWEDEIDEEDFYNDDREDDIDEDDFYDDDREDDIDKDFDEVEDDLEDWDDIGYIDDDFEDIDDIDEEDEYYDDMDDDWDDEEDDEAEDEDDEEDDEEDED